MQTSPRWSKKQAWDWYNEHPWYRGCNFMSSDCANRVDQWQALGFEERLATTDRELELASSIGFNSVRLIVQFEVWQQEHDGFMERLERTFATCAKHNISVMLCLANDCSVPKALYEPKKMGKQPCDWGYHGGVKKSSHKDNGADPGFTVLDDPELAPLFYKMCEEIITKYANDPRVVFWDLINEPGNNHRGEISCPQVQKLFELAWDINPSQPLTSCTWTNPIRGSLHAEQLATELSDIVTYHNYSDFTTFVTVTDFLREKYERPLVNTEWLHRIQHNDVAQLFPFFYYNKIGCYNWGFVAGLYQTYEPWERFWQQAEKGTLDPTLDLTKWQHDLFRPSLHPYDPKEIAIIKHFTQLADKKAFPSV